MFLSALYIHTTNEQIVLALCFFSFSPPVLYHYLSLANLIYSVKTVMDKKVKVCMLIFRSESFAHLEYAADSIIERSETKNLQTLAI